MPQYTIVNSKVVAVPVHPGGHVVARRGAMLAYTGDVRFYPATAGQGGGMGSLMGMAGRAMAGESSPLMVADGTGEVLYGHQGLHVTVVDLDGTDALTTESDRLLVHDGSLNTSVVPLTNAGGGMRGALGGAVRGAVTGHGMFTTQLTGRGSVALLAHGDLLELPVNGQLGVDPQAYVGHVGNIRLELTTLGAGSMFRDAVGHGSGESIQLKVTGTGTVFVQTSERKF